MQLFQKSAARSVAAKAGKKTQVVRPSSGKSTRGWLGGEGGAQTDLSKWYGEYRRAGRAALSHQPGTSPSSFCGTAAALIAGNG